MLRCREKRCEQTKSAVYWFDVKQGTHRKSNSNAAQLIATDGGMQVARQSHNVDRVEKDRGETVFFSESCVPTTRSQL